MNFKICLFNQGEVRDYLLEDYVLVGSAEKNHIYLEGLCAKHFRILRKGITYHIQDLRSQTGTYVNTQKIGSAVLNPGDTIRAGKYEFVFLEQSSIFEIEKLKSHNPHWNEVILRMPSYAKSDLPVLVLGESGSGKEQISQYIHKFSTRSMYPAVTVNCSALTASLAESELFGHVKGSFTGATQDRKGAFEEARNGTLILDEIGDLPLDLQPKLLRAIENKEVRPVGGDHVIQTNCRIVACTHHNLLEKVYRGEFRLDLFYRLNVIQVKVPPLRERKEDFEKILFEFAREMKVRFSFETITFLKEHSWPGNIRELKNLVSRCRIQYPNQKIQTRDVEPFLQRHASESSLTSEPSKETKNIIREIEREIIIKKLAMNFGNQKKTAEDLGIPKSTFYDRVKHYKINVHVFKK